MEGEPAAKLSFLADIFLVVSDANVFKNQSGMRSIFEN